MNKFLYIFLLLLLGFIILFTFFYISAKPLNPIMEMKKGIVENMEVIDTIETEDGIMVYSVGEANQGENYMYFVDKVKRKLTGFEWLGGGSHVNEDVPMNDPFILSLQLLNENMNVDPTIFGVIKDSKVINVDIKAGNEVMSGNFYQGKDKERFYVAPLTHKVSSDNFFEIEITYKDKTKEVYHIPTEQLPELQEGKAFYLDKEDFR